MRFRSNLIKGENPMDKLGYVWAAYSIAWLLIFGYTMILGQRQSKIASEMEMLQDAVAKRED